MTTYHYISESAPKALVLNRGEMEVLADGGVRWCGVYSGELFHLTADEIRGRGVVSAEEYAKHASTLNYYKIVCNPAPEQTASLTFPSGACVQLAGDKIVGRIAPEPVRAPLDWNTTTKHDTFGPDFIVTKGAEPTAPLYDSPTTDSAYPAIAGLLRG